MTHAMPRHCENGAETRERARLTDLVSPWSAVYADIAAML